MGALSAGPLESLFIISLCKPTHAHANKISTWIWTVVVSVHRLRRLRYFIGTFWISNVLHAQKDASATKTDVIGVKNTQTDIFLLTRGVILRLVGAETGSGRWMEIVSAHRTAPARGWGQRCVEPRATDTTTLGTGNVSTPIPKATRSVFAQAHSNSSRTRTAKSIVVAKVSPPQHSSTRICKTATHACKGVSATKRVATNANTHTSSQSTTNANAQTISLKQNPGVNVSSPPITSKSTLWSAIAFLTWITPNTTLASRMGSVGCAQQGVLVTKMAVCNARPISSGTSRRSVMMSMFAFAWRMRMKAWKGFAGAINSIKNWITRLVAVIFLTSRWCSQMKPKISVFPALLGVFVMKQDAIDATRLLSERSWKIAMG